MTDFATRMYEVLKYNLEKSFSSFYFEHFYSLFAWGKQVTANLISFEKIIMFKDNQSIFCGLWLIVKLINLAAVTFVYKRA